MIWNTKICPQINIVPSHFLSYYSYFLIICNLEVPVTEGVPDGGQEDVLVLLLVGGGAEAHGSVPGHVLGPEHGGRASLAQQVIVEHLAHYLLGGHGVLREGDSGDGGGDTVHGIRGPHEPFSQR